MVDDIFTNNNNSNKESSQRHNLLTVNNYSEIDDELDILNNKTDNRRSSQYETSISSPAESTSENAFSLNGSKFPVVENDKNNDKKVHWNPSQVHFLLDCIEKRLFEFRKKSVHKSVWLTIGREMLEHGDFSVEHCYNKWKNLRRDVRLFNNSTSMQKLSIRNAFIMERVQKMVIEIGYENGSRKSSSSPISPVDSLERVSPENGSKKGENWAEIPKIKPESMESMESIDFIDGNGNNYVSLEDSIISLLSDPSVSQTILMNPKLLEEILPGLDIATVLKKFVDSHPEILAISENRQTVNCNNSQSNCNNSERQTFVNSLPAQTTLNNNNGGSWPHQLYELLHSFREEESRQMQRLDQIVNCVQVMQESTKRRLSTINQLISLAGMLIPQR